jgi:hypothetical protein
VSGGLSRPDRFATGASAALVVATVLALVPWLGLLLSATVSVGSPSGTTTQKGCSPDLCLDFSHFVLRATIGIAAVCAAIGIAIAVLVRRGSRIWAGVVIALALVAMALYVVSLV